MTDTYIVPKWCFTLLVLLVSIFVLSIKKLCNKTIRIDIAACGCIIVLITFCQALYGIGQWFQWILEENWNLYPILYEPSIYYGKGIYQPFQKDFV